MITKNNFLFIFFLLTISSFELFGSWKMGEYQWRNDDGNEINASAIAPINTPIVVQKGQRIRLRQQITNDNMSPMGFTGLKLTVDDDSGAIASFDVTTDGTTNPIQIVDSPFFNDQDPTSQFLFGSSMPPINNDGGYLIDNSNSVSTMRMFDYDSEVELEWSLLVTENAVPGNQYSFRLNVMGSSVSYNPNAIPRIRVANNITIPTLSDWGLYILILLLLNVGVTYFRAKRIYEYSSLK